MIFLSPSTLAICSTERRICTAPEGLEWVRGRGGGGVREVSGVSVRNELVVGAFWVDSK